MPENILIRYLQWHFYDAPAEILTGWRNFLEFGLNYFSIPLLLKTLFLPWRRYSESYGKGFDLGRWFDAFTFNMMSRGIGAIMRFFFIIIGLTIEAFIFIGGAAVFLAWLILPILLIFGFIVGIRLAM